MLVLNNNDESREIFTLQSEAALTYHAVLCGVIGQGMK
jgi:hypothetical protein